MNEHSIGIDTVNVNRIKNIIDKYDKAFFKKIFTDLEVDYCQSKPHQFIHFAGKFAAKEATKKALFSINENFFVGFNKIEVCNNKSGMPFIKILSNEIVSSNINKIKVSISHTDKIATSIVLIS